MDYQPQSGSTLWLGDSGQAIDLANPGMMNPSQINPYAAPYLQNNQNLYSMFSHSAAGGAFNPDFYNGMQMKDQQALTTSLGNQYARMGLSGSSAEMGGISSAIQNNQMNWLNREQGDQMRAMQGLEGLNQTGLKDVMGIQGQYGDYQDAAAQSALNAYGYQTEQDAANKQMWGQIIGGGLMGGGMAAAALA